MRSALQLTVLPFLTACQMTGHPATTAALGETSSGDALEALIDVPGPITLEVVRAADWAVPLSGLLNLDHPEAQRANLDDRIEPIQIYFYALRHPSRGLFLVDTGVEAALEAAPDRAAVRGLVASVMHLEAMKVHQSTAAWLAAQPDRLAGVFLTHLHLDHVMGLPDIPRGTPIYLGPGETSVRKLENAAVQPIIDRVLEGHGALREWRYEPDASGRFDGVLDVFGDGSLWALHSPGHTPGSTAYLVRTPTGPTLLLGDACHTEWGWAHGVEPGSFSHDLPQSARSLHRLKALAAAHPTLTVRAGHQAPIPAP